MSEPASALLREPEEARFAEVPRVALVAKEEGKGEGRVRDTSPRAGQGSCLSEGVRLQHGDTVQIEGRSFVIQCAGARPQTNEAISAVVRLGKGDRVAVGVKQGDTSGFLRDCRRAALFAELAGRRLKDGRKGIAEPEQGWVSRRRLADQLDQDPNYLAQTILRLRKWCVQTGLRGAESLVQTRLRPSEVRLGIGSVYFV